MVRLLVFLWLACLPGFAQLPVIFDTDMGNDVDDALALAMLHALENRGECKLIGVTLTNAHPDAVPFIHMMNRFYGRPSIPVGAAMATVKGGANPGFLTPALEAAPARLRIMNRMATPPAVVLLRSLLAESAGKVAIVQVGFSTNLAALLDSPADAISPLSGRELIRQKVGILSVMAGNFEAATPEYNVKQDIPPLSLATRQSAHRLWEFDLPRSGVATARRDPRHRWRLLHLCCRARRFVERFGDPLRYNG